MYRAFWKAGLSATVMAMSSSAQAYYENYLANFVSYFPPACVTNISVLEDFNTSGSQVLLEGLVDWINLAGEVHALDVVVVEKGCPDSARRVLLVELELLDNSDGFDDFAFMPQPWGRIDGDPQRYRFRLNEEPNTNEAIDNFGILTEGVRMTFFLDSHAPLAADFDFDELMPVADYNGAFLLEFDDPGGGGVSGEVPAYLNNLRAANMTLTGRLSGNWSTPGIPDQGFLLAFNELASDPDGFLFLSWYTYDADGNLLWLTGGNSYDIYATQVSFDIVLVTNGEFLGDKLADREVVGTATLRAYDCNNLSLTYNLNGISLGAGTIPLRRLFSLEIQGYTCGDFETRLEHINDID
ncbi:MAG TPA: hypothetical protein VI566_10380 [Xanthomonadales bacterium]|nr:hypothetical protein [Xanthomonadales bacterium]